MDATGYNNVGAIAHVVPPPENNSRPRMPCSRAARRMNRPTAAQLGNAVWTIVSLRKWPFPLHMPPNLLQFDRNAVVEHFYEISKQSFVSQPTLREGK
jgi:hypothetical protein